jgi:ABC-type multidrug transport system fused ATPase/permease subunit
MMWEVAGGIVIAVLILRFWPLIIGAALFIVVLGVVAALGYLAWWGVTSGEFHAVVAPLAFVGLSAIVGAYANTYALSRASPAFFREYPSLSRLLLVFLYVAVVVAILTTIGIVDRAFSKRETQRTAQKNVFEDILSTPDDQFAAAPSAMTPPQKAAPRTRLFDAAPDAVPVPAATPRAIMTPSLQGRIDSYTVGHYRKCWTTALSINALTYTPRVEFRLSRAGELEGEPRLLNPSSNPSERARGEQALAAVRRCSPMPIPEEFAPYYDYWHVTELDVKEDMR